MRNTILKSNWILLPLLMVFVIQIAQSQQTNNKYNLLLKSGTTLLDENISSVISDGSLDMLSVFEGKHYCFMQFNNIPSQQQRELIENSGIELLDYIPNYAYIASIPEGFNTQLLTDYNIRSISRINGVHKLSNTILAPPYPDWAMNDDGTISIVVKYYKNADQAAVKSAIIDEKVEIISSNDDSQILTIVIKVKDIDNVANLPYVMYLETISPAPVPDDTEARSLHRVNAVNSAYAAGRHYDGTGVVCGLADDGAIGPHIDYTGRLTQHTVGYGGTHGDMTSGILMGCGNINPLIVGSAPGAYLQLYNINGYPHINNAVANLNNLGTVITSTSYSQTQGGVYNADASQGDRQIREHPTLIHVFSAGNAGTQDHGYGAGPGWANITGGYKAAKNTIATGNLDYLGNLANSSSRGPADDGRIKPDICANGVDQLSTDPPNTYDPGGGTSAAAPSIAGIVATLYHAYKDLNNGQNPESPLIKGTLLNTTEDDGNPGPDFKFGWGRVNTLRAVRVLEENRYIGSTIEQDSVQSHTITVPTGVEQLRVMVYWLDYEGAPNAARALVNDLNMQLLDPTFQPFNPWVLDHTPNPTTLDLPATRGIDSVNNMEQVTIEDPVAGQYTVEVHGYQVPQGPQKYYIIYEFMKDEIEVTYPLGGEAFAPWETQTIHWDAWGDTGDFTIEYSADSGATWNMISNNVNGIQRYFNWTIPNILTGNALIKVSRGTLSDQGEAVFTIMEVPYNLYIDWACPDTCQMSWNNVLGATEYEVSWLGNMYMDSIGTTTNTYMKIGGINPVDEYWFSVKALGANNEIGRRAIAINKVPGVFNCIIPIDAELTQLLPPPSTFQDCQNNSNIDIEINIKNVGTLDLSNIDVFYRLDTNTIVAEMYSGTITPGNSANYTFTVPIDLSVAGNYKITSWLSYLNDGNKYNDTLYSYLNTIVGVIVTPDTMENMESFTLCSTEMDCEAINCPLENGWINVMNLEGDDIDWRTNSGSTPSNNTGPNNDHTLGNSSGKYIYLESSECFYKEAHLISPCIDLTNITAPILEFWYNMRGGDMGELHVDILTNQTWVVDVMPVLSGNQGSSWNQRTVDLTAYIGQIINIRFRGITGDYYQSDMALDDINITSLTGISEDILNSQIQIYPNPGNGVFNLNIHDLGEENIEVTVSDPQGRTLYQKNINDLTTNYKSSIDLSGFSKGIYFVNLKNDNLTHTRRIIIQ